jgi:hypothetical protein
MRVVSLGSPVAGDTGPGVAWHLTGSGEEGWRAQRFTNGNPDDRSIASPDYLMVADYLRLLGLQRGRSADPAVVEVWS